MRNGVLALSLTVAASGATWAQDAEKPNIIIIYSDDQGYADLSLRGVDPNVRTPNLDQLARDGVNFPNAYTTAPQCVPSRAALLTGRHQNNFGMDDNHKGPLPLTEKTIATRLQGVGYVTGMVGKWHLAPLPRHRRYPDGEQPAGAYDPRNRGFEEYWYGSLHRYEANIDLKGNLLPDAPVVVNDPRYRIDVQTEAALSFLERRKGSEKPFFLYLAYFAPHAPMEAPPHYMSRLEHVKERERRMGLASILAMDDGVGKIREKLKELGVSRNTLIFYISDNGAPLRDRAYIGSLNKPLIGEKGMLTDGGQRVPYLMAWPGKLQAGGEFSEMVSTMDASATALSVAGVPLDAKIEGRDLVPYVQGEKTGPVHDALYWRWRSQAAIRKGNWKFVRLGDEKRYLFDMSKAGTETSAENKISEHPGMAEELEKLLVEAAEGWETPGLPQDVVGADAAFFAMHVEQTATAPDGAAGIRNPARAKAGSAPGPNTRSAAREGSRAKGEEGPLQGWIARNLHVQELGAEHGVRLVPDRGMPFITILGLDLKVPVRVSTELRCEQPAELKINWRNAGAKTGFDDRELGHIQYDGSGEWRELNCKIGRSGSIGHIRLVLPDGLSEMAVREVVLEGSDGQRKVYRFGQKDGSDRADQENPEMQRTVEGIK